MVTIQMERFPDLVDFFQISVWERATENIWKGGDLLRKTWKTDNVYYIQSRSIRFGRALKIWRPEAEFFPNGSLPERVK